MTTKPTSGYAMSFISYGFDLIYPRTPIIAIAAEWVGRDFYHRSRTWTPYYLINVLYKLESMNLKGVFESITGSKSNDSTWYDVFTGQTLHLYYPHYVEPYLPQIHYAVGISAAAAVSISLNLIARVFFGIKSNKDEQKLPLANALGVPTAPKVNDDQNAIDIIKKEPKPKAVQKREAAHKMAKPASIAAREKKIQKKEYIEQAAAKSLTTPFPDKVLPRAEFKIDKPVIEQAKEANELLLDLDEFKKFAEIQTCSWNPIRVINMTTC